MVFDRLKTYFLQRLTSGFVIVFRRRDGAMIVNAGLLSTQQLQNLACSLGSTYCERICRDRQASWQREAEQQVRQLISQ